MKPRTVVYGLGRVFQKKYVEIHEAYNIVGYCDSNPEKVAMFSTGMTKEELAAHPERYDQLLITPRQAVEIVADLALNYGLDTSKFVSLPQPRLAIQAKKDGYFHPEEIFFGVHYEDAILLMLCEKLNLDYGKFTYLEVGLHDLRQGSITYNLYKHGARGVLGISSYASLYDEASLFRPDDTFYLEDTWKESLGQYERFDIIAAHDKRQTKYLLNKGNAFEYNPMVLVLYENKHEMIQFVQRNGYVWYSTIAATETIFYRRDL